MKSNISRPEFLKRIGAGAFLAIFSTFVPKMTSNAMVGDNLAASIKDNTTEEMIKEITFPVGSIIHSSTCKAMEDVIKTYGGNKWVQHSNYFLRGVSSGVTKNRVVADGGEDTHTLTVNEMPSHTHVQNAHNHAQNAHSHSIQMRTSGSEYSGCGLVKSGTFQNRVYVTGSVSYTDSTTATNIAATATNQNTGGGKAHNNIPKYKGVYIWERVE